MNYYKRLAKKHGQAFADQLRKDFEDYSTHLKNGGFVPSGGWCSSHEKYDCPCWKEENPELANQPFPLTKSHKDSNNG